ncbi:MAG TPA: hypothetical protein VF578_15205 [Methylomirabilota bacterium]|jgi:uncharacterized membrane protein YeaQ/YmgE (transglycosylase-associated protein family)
MKVPISVIWVPMGLVVGGLAGLVMRTGGYGLIVDLVLGLAGSLIGSLLFLAVETSPEAGWPTVCAGTFVGAASVIAGQRWWYAHA